MSHLSKPIQPENDDSHNNLNNYIQNLDVSTVLSVDLGLENHQQQYIRQQPIYRGQESIQATDKEAQQKELTTQIHAQEDDKSKTEDEEEDSPGLYVPYDIPGVPPIPAGIDPKRICPFCQKTFAHPGSMGRHLDLKKGSKSHPANIIDQMRADVKRRGTGEQTALEKKRLRSKRYNSKKEVKERTKINRRFRDKLTRAKKAALVAFYKKLGKPQLQSHPTFARIVLYFLTPNQWPHDPPNLETYKILCGEINDKFYPSAGQDSKDYEDLMQKVHLASENWMTLVDSIKQDIWIRELRRAAEDALTNTSLFELNNRDELILSQANAMIENREKNLELDSDTENESDDQSNEQEETHNDSSYVYNQAELAAVAEAMVNTNKTADGPHLDPQLMN